MPGQLKIDSTTYAAGEDEPGLEADERDERQRGDLEPVDEEDPPLGDAAGPSGPDMILAQGLEEATGGSSG